MARPKPWDVDDELWALIELLLPKVERRIRHPGRKRHPDRLLFQGILFVLHTGIAWEHLPQGLGFSSGMTCWRRLAEWTEAGVWPRLHEVLLAQLSHCFRRYRRCGASEAGPGAARTWCWATAATTTTSTAAWSGISA